MDDFKQIKNILSEDHKGAIPLEHIVGGETSPLNHTVIEKDIGGNTTVPPVDKEEAHATTDNSDTGQDYDDAPEQEINEDYSQEDTWEEEFELPANEAKMASDSILGVANNVLAIGAGFFVKIKKHKEFYEFDEVIQVIDEQNEKNVNRFKLDEGDQALLRPLLMAFVKTKAKEMSPQNQLSAVLISILLKKAQTFMEVRAENENLVERILTIVKEENGEPTVKEESVHEPSVDNTTVNDEVDFEELPNVIVPPTEILKADESSNE